MGLCLTLRITLPNTFLLMKTKLTIALLLAILLPLTAFADDNVLRLTGEIRDRGTDAQLPKTH